MFILIEFKKNKFTIICTIKNTNKITIASFLDFFCVSFLYFRYQADFFHDSP